MGGGGDETWTKGGGLSLFVTVVLGCIAMTLVVARKSAEERQRQRGYDTLGGNYELPSTLHQIKESAVQPRGQRGSLVAALSRP